MNYYIASQLVPDKQTHKGHNDKDHLSQSILKEVKYPKVPRKS